MIRSKTLIIGDTHLEDKIPGHLNHQIETLTILIEKEIDDLKHIIFLGDITDSRKPSPTILLTFRLFIHHIKSLNPNINIWIIRGNHDSETKSDDGITALSLFEEIEGVKVITQYIDEFIGIPVRFIAHYEKKTKE